MTLSQLITQIRLELDDTVEPYLWSDAEITSYINEAVDILCSKYTVNKEIADPNTYTVSASVSGDTISLSNPFNLYENDVITISNTNTIDGDYTVKSATLNSITATSNIGTYSGDIDISVKSSVTTVPIVSGVDFYIYPYMEYIIDIDDTVEFLGNSVKFDYIAVMRNNRIFLRDEPSENGFLYMNVVRRALYSLDADNPEVEPDIPRRYHKALIPYAKYRCYSKADADTLNPKAKTDAYTDWILLLKELGNSITRAYEPSAPVHKGLL